MDVAKMFFMMGVSWCVIGVGVFVIKSCAGGRRGFWWETGLVFLLLGLQIPTHGLPDFQSERAGRSSGVAGVITVQKDGFHTANLAAAQIELGVITVQKDGFHTFPDCRYRFRRGVITVQKDGFHTRAGKIRRYMVGVITVQKDGFHTAGISIRL